MKQLLAIIFTIISIFSCTNYHNGNMSNHFDGNRFFDPEIKNTNNFWNFLKWQITKKSTKWPDSVEVIKYDLPPKRVFGDEIRISNVGHVTFLIQTQGLNILTDPVWSERASPVSFAGPKRVIKP